MGSPAGVGMHRSVNGDVRQDGTVDDMIFSVPHVIWYLSQCMTLERVTWSTPAHPPVSALGCRRPPTCGTAT